MSANSHPARRRGQPCRSLVVVVTVVIFLAGNGLRPAAAQTLEATPAAGDAYADILPGERDAVVAATERDVSRYDMDIAVDATAGTVGGSLSVAFVNRYGEPLSEVVFRLFPNADHYGDGGTTLEDVTLDGEPVDPVLSVGDTVVSIPLTADLAPGASVTVAMTFETTVPVDSSGSYGILSRSTASGAWTLADWYPSLAGYEPAPGAGWRRDPPIDDVDPTFGDVAMYDLTLRSAGLTVLATGSQIESSDDTAGTTTTRIAAGPVRDLTLALGTGWEMDSRQVGETTVTYATDVNDDAAIDAVLDVVARSLEVYGERFGTYPYRELDLVDVPLTSGTLGISWSGLVYLDGPSLARQAADEQFLDFLLAHEVGHQWWGNLVGGNSNDHTFITEGLTNYTMTMEVEWTQGRAAAVDMLRTYVAPRYLTLLRSGGDSIADVPYPEAPAGFGDLVYGKAALGFLAIRLAIGDDAFFTALRSFASDSSGLDAPGFRFRVAEPSDLLAAFEAAGGPSVTPVWEDWFEQADTTPEEVEQLIADYAAA